MQKSDINDMLLLFIDILTRVTIDMYFTKFLSSYQITKSCEICIIK